MCRQLNEACLKNYAWVKKPLVSNKNKKERVEFAKKYFNKPDTFWDNIIWRYESKFEIFNVKKRNKGVEETRRRFERCLYK